MTFAFHPEAEKEFFKAIDYYEECRKTLGYDFALEVYSTINRIIAFPTAWTEVGKGIRRCLTRRFPYGILFEVKGGNILILTVMDLHRRPHYWKHRTKG
jgi:hypothetical protein